MRSLCLRSSSPYLAGQLLRWRAGATRSRPARRGASLVSRARSSPRVLSTRLLIDHPLCPLEPPVSGGYHFWWLEHAHCSWRPDRCSSLLLRCPSRAFNHQSTTTPHRAPSGSGVLPAAALSSSPVWKREKGSRDLPPVLPCSLALENSSHPHLLYCTATCLFMDPATSMAAYSSSRVSER